MNHRNYLRDPEKYEEDVRHLKDLISKNRRNLTRRDYERLTETPPAKTRHEHLIRYRDKINPTYSIKEMAAITGINQNTLRRELPRLVREGYAIRVSKGRYRGI